MKVIVSACLLGRNCKYSGGNNLDPAVVRYLEGRETVPVCPECQAGLGTPRTPIEIVDGVLTCRDGTPVDAVLRRTAEAMAAELMAAGADMAILQSRSPTCGVNQVYDGSFSGKLISGSGIFAQALKDAGYRVVDVEDLERSSE